METVSRISSMLETARELTIEAAQSASSSRAYKPVPSVRNGSFSQIKKLLDSRSDRDILDGLRKVIALMYRTGSCLPFFSSVVKNVANPNIEVKKLVYIYLLHHAEAEPDLALLSINTIQKSLTDQNPQVRAMALRTMSGIKVPVISQIVSLAIKRGCGDMSPHVRKAAALAIPKCFRLDPGTLPQLMECLSTLLGDNQYSVAGPAVSAFLEICPDRLDLIHKHYRSLVKKLVDMDEWGQLATMKLMMVYSRKCFPRRTKKVSKTNNKGFYDDDNDGDNTHEEVTEEVEVLDPDLDLYLKACKQLLHSRNSAVIVGVVRSFRYLGPVEYLESAVGPLIALLRSPKDVQEITLYNIISLALVIPRAFVKYVTHFLIRSTDLPNIWRLKLEILTILFPHTGMHLKSVILGELEHFSNGPDSELVRESVRAIGRCAENDAASSTRCLQLLLRQISSADETLVSEAMTVIRHLIQQDPSSHQKTVVMLANHLESTSSPGARASIIWLVGEFAGMDKNNTIAPDVLRILAKKFADETEIAKQQILLLGAKVYLHHLLNTADTPQTQPEGHQNYEGDGYNYGGDEDEDTKQENTNDNEDDNITTLWRYILLLARYDTSYDLRDRARLYKSLLAVPSSTQLASLLLLAPKPIPHTPTPSETRKNLLLGSSTLVIGPEAGMYGLRGYEDLPDWVEAGDEPDPSLRDDGLPKSSGGGVSQGVVNVSAGSRLDKALQEHGGTARGRRSNGGMMVGSTKNVSLDDWLAEEEESEESEGSTEDEDEDESEEESGEEDASEDEEEETDEGSEEEEEEEEEEEDGDNQVNRPMPEDSKLLK